MTPAAIYDAVLMNPPFCGTHWMDHVRHAFAFLKPGGRLRAILPASAEVAETKKHLAFRRWAEQHARRWGWQWRRMPAESFASVGTRINTVVLELRAKGE
ncbi:MAG: adenine methyltransferase, partial [Pseudomonadota bacterium]